MECMMRGRRMIVKWLVSLFRVFCLERERSVLNVRVRVQCHCIRGKETRMSVGSFLRVVLIVLIDRIQLET